MRIGVNLGPTANWTTVLETARKADDYGFDAVSFLDHYQAQKLEWGIYAAGRSMARWQWRPAALSWCQW